LSTGVVTCPGVCVDGQQGPASRRSHREVVVPHLDLEVELAADDVAVHEPLHENARQVVHLEGDDAFAPGAPLVDGHEPQGVGAVHETTGVEPERVRRLGQSVRRPVVAVHVELDTYHLSRHRRSSVHPGLGTPGQGGALTAQKTIQRATYSVSLADASRP
jgi:hypothetical protein